MIRSSVVSSASLRTLFFLMMGGHESGSFVVSFPSTLTSHLLDNTWIGSEKNFYSKIVEWSRNTTVHQISEYIYMKERKVQLNKYDVCAVPWQAYFFSTSDRLLSDVLLLSKVREFEHFQCISVYERPNSASHGLGLSLSANQMTGNRVRECMGGRERPNSASHRLGLTQFVMWSVWANQRSDRTPTKDSASQTPGEAMRLAVKSVRRARGSYCLAR